MKYSYYMDYGEKLYVANIAQMGTENANFRTTVWTGCHLQMTLMSIPACGEIGLEIHNDSDQLLRVEQGEACVMMGKYKNRLDFEQIVCKGDVIFVPAGTWHNVINTQTEPLKLSVVYAPPVHPKGTIHCTKADAEKAE